MDEHHAKSGDKKNKTKSVSFCSALLLFWRFFFILCSNRSPFSKMEVKNKLEEKCGSEVQRILALPARWIRSAGASAIMICMKSNYDLHERWGECFLVFKENAPWAAPSAHFRGVHPFRQFV